MERRRLTLANSHEGGGGGPIDINNYLTIEALEDGLTAQLSKADVEYCVDGDGNWITLAAGTATQSINAGQTLSFKINNPTDTQSISTYVVSSEGSFINTIGTFSITKYCNILGNVMSMLFGDNADDNLSLSGEDYAFYLLFSGCTTIINVSSDFLPATTLARGCYYHMFNGCTSLQTAPELPATTLAESCYYNMFHSCNNLNYIKMLATDISAYGCLYGWVSGVASSGTFVKNHNMTSLPTGNSGIPSGWTVQNA